MYYIEVKGRDMIRLANDSEVDALLKTIAPLAIVHKGESFTFKRAFIENDTTYCFEGLIPHWRTSSTRTYEKDYKAICKRLEKELPSGVGCETTYETFSDGCAKKNNRTYGTYADVVGGRIFTFTVSRKYSKALYDKHMAAAMPFCDHLLKNRRPTIESVLRKVDVLGYDGRGIPSFSVTKTGIYPCYKEEGKFSTYGMTNLETIGECYGFVLAVLQILKEKRKGYAEAKVNLSAIPAGDGFAVKLEFPPPKKPELTKW